jgi:hypothetical protein
MAKKRRNLKDLYVKGKEVVFDDGSGDEPVVVWVQRLSDLHHQEVVRKASARRAEVRARLGNHDSEEYLELLDDAASFDREICITYLLSDEEMELRQSIEAELELGEDSEWAKDGYARGLVDAWAERLEAKYVEDPSDPEVLHVLAELRRFGEEVDRLLEPQLADARTALEVLSDEALQHKVVEKFIDSRLAFVWMDEFERAAVWRGTRDPDDHRQLYFDDREEVDHLAPEIREGLVGAFKSLMVDLTEGKGSPASPASSISSATRALAVALEASGPGGAAASKTSPSS